jgi:hypothetical protein
MAEPPDAFRDPDGQPEFAQCAVLFLDLLGTAGETEPARMLDRLRRRKRAVELARDLTPKDEGNSGLWRMSWFSDNLGLHYAVSGPVVPSQAIGFMVSDVGWLQLAFLTESLIARGAIAFGAFYSDNEFIDGPALERAVDLEKKAAKHPRVLLDERSAAIAHASLIGEYGGSLIAPWRTQLLVDEQANTFVDYLATLDDYDAESPVMWKGDLERHRQVVVDGLRDNANDDYVIQKYVWLAAYHNDFLRRYDWFLGGLADELRIEEPHATATFRPFGHDVEPPDGDE